MSTDLIADCAHPNSVDAVEISSPRLPPEIEYEIFMLAYNSERKASTKLICVAKRVRDWLISLIYNLIVIDSGFKPEQMLPKLEKYGHYVHHVAFMRLLEDAENSEIFKLCPNIWNLAIWGGHVIAPSGYMLTGLKRLTLNNLERSGLAEVAEEIGKMDGVEQPTGLRLHSAWFSNITHLMVSDSDMPTGGSSKPYLLFPNLTHFLTISATKFTVEILQDILCSHPKLEVVVWLLMYVAHEDKTFVVDFDSDKVLKIDDERVVTIDGRLSSSWIKAAKGEVEFDMWKLAERTIEARKAGSSVHV